MNKILILNTGGTFNKKYCEISGTLKVLEDNSNIELIVKKAFRNNLNLDIKGVLYKDSLEINDINRKEILENLHVYKKILIVHGTDTMDMTAKFLANKIKKDQTVVLTGAMHPFSIDVLEAVANFSISLSFLNQNHNTGVYIGMHGLVKEYTKIHKNKKLGIFECQK